MKLFFPLIIYIARAIRFRDIRGGSEGLGAEKGEEGGGRIFRRSRGGCPTGGFPFPEREERDGRADGSGTGILQVSGIPVRLLLF